MGGGRDLFARYKHDAAVDLPGVVDGLALVVNFDWLSNLLFQIL